MSLCDDHERLRDIFCLNIKKFHIQYEISYFLSLS